MIYLDSCGNKGLLHQDICNNQPCPSLVCVLSHFSCLRLFATLWTVAHKAPLSMGFSRQEHWSGFPCPPPGDLPNPGIEPVSLKSPVLAGGSWTPSFISPLFTILYHYYSSVIFLF